MSAMPLAGVGAPPLLLAFLLLYLPTLAAGQFAANDPLVAAPATTAPAEPYDTELGPLERAGLSVMPGANVQFRGGGQLHVTAGFAEVPKGAALAVDGIRNWFDFPGTAPRGVTLVRDKGSGKWLATDGVLAIAEGNLVLIDGQEVRVVGGPFTVRDAAFTNQTFVLRKGQPQAVAAPAADAARSGAAGGIGTAVIVGVVSFVAVAVAGAVVVLAARRGRGAAPPAA